MLHFIFRLISLLIISSIFSITSSLSYASSRCNNLFSDKNSHATITTFRITGDFILHILNEKHLEMTTSDQQEIKEAFFQFDAYDSVIEGVRKEMPSEEQLNASWIKPVALGHPISLFRGTLFPSMFFLRRNTYVDGAGMNLNLRPDHDFKKTGEREPYIVLNREGNSQAILNNGSKHLLNLIADSLQNSNPPGQLTLYRGASKAEKKLQIFLKEVSLSLAQDSTASRDWVLKSLKDLLDDFIGNKYMSQKAKSSLKEVYNSAKNPNYPLINIRNRLIDSLTPEVDMTFTTLDQQAAAIWAKQNDGAVLTYQVNITDLLNLNQNIYAGIEADYIEIAFIGREGKNYLINRLVK